MVQKRFVPISESLLFLAARLAERTGMPTREFIEYVLAEVLKSLQYRNDILEVISISDMLDDLRRSGGVVLPQNVVYKIVELLDEDNYVELIEEMKKVAKWYGTLIRVKRGADVSTLKLLLSVWFPDMNANIIDKGNGLVTVVITSSRQPARVTKLVGEVITALCKAMGVQVNEMIVEQGIVRVSISGISKVKGEEIETE